MKTYLLIATVMLFSAATFGQQTETKTTQSEAVKAATIKNGKNASVQANASTRVKSKASVSGNNKLSQDASLNSGLKASSSDAKSRVDGLGQEGQATAHTKTNESLKTTATEKNEADNGIAKTASSSRSDLNKTQTTAKSSVDAGSSIAVHEAGGIKKSVKPHPASIKVQSQIKANAGIKIK
jgi:hypothetical protein